MSGPMMYGSRRATFKACGMCEIPQPRFHFPTQLNKGEHIPRSTCAPCRTAMDSFLVHVDWRQATYACPICGGIQGKPFIPNACRECDQIFRRFRPPMRRGQQIPIPELRAMFHRNYHVALMQRVVAEVGMDDITAVFDCYRPEAMLTCPCNKVAGPRSDPAELRCSQTLDFWEIWAVLTGQL